MLRGPTMQRWDELLTEDSPPLHKNPRPQRRTQRHDPEKENKHYWTWPWRHGFKVMGEHPYDKIKGSLPATHLLRVAKTSKKCSPNIKNTSRWLLKSHETKTENLSHRLVEPWRQNHSRNCDENDEIPKPTKTHLAWEKHGADRSRGWNCLGCFLDPVCLDR